MSSIDSAIDLNAGSVSENVKTTLRGELVLAFAVIINSLGVVLMLTQELEYLQSQAFHMLFPKSSLRLLLVHLHICSRDFLYSAL